MKTDSSSSRNQALDKMTTLPVKRSYEEMSSDDESQCSDDQTTMTAVSPLHNFQTQLDELQVEIDSLNTRIAILVSVYSESVNKQFVFALVLLTHLIIACIYIYYLY